MTKLWGSRFKKGTDQLADQFTFSIGYDYKLAKYDCLGSIAHAKMLGSCRIIPSADSKALVAGLAKILKKIEAGRFVVNPKSEDIHSQIQAELKNLIGKPADKLHTARSRNDQVVLDVKLYCKDHLVSIIKEITRLQKAVLAFAEKNEHVIFPAYTHLQAAQVVLLAHHALAYVNMLERDKGRISDALKRLDVLPLGSCALSGTTLPTNRKKLARDLHFAAVSANSIDAVSDRDFIAEALSALAILAMHYSRIAEELIIWTSQEFGLIDIDWAFCTGSSIMPHKKNPDVLELVRGETGRIYGHLQEVLVLLKGLPLTYNRDLQLDKPPLFAAVESVELMTPLLAKLFAGIQVNFPATKKRINDESFFTVDVMEYLISKGMSYRQGHDTVGRMVKECLDKGNRIKDLPLEKLKKYSKLFENDVKSLLNPEASVRRKKSSGSTNPRMVAAEIRRWKKALTTK